MRKIVVVPHENHWGEKFQIEAERLKSAMPETVKIHHIGSTSVPGLAAKPIIDMIMEVENIDRVDRWNERFIEPWLHRKRRKWYSKTPLFYSWNGGKTFVSLTRV